MLGQIGRGDTVIRRMNRFAHSVDQDCASVDLDGLVTLVVELFRRTAAMRGITVDVQSSGEALRITTHPFALETLLGSLLEQLSLALPGIGALSIVLHTDAERRISIPALAEHAQAVAQVLQSDELNTLLADLQASAGFSRERGELFITLPETLDV